MTVVVPRAALMKCVLLVSPLDRLKVVLEQAALSLRENSDLGNWERAALEGEIALFWAILFYWMGQGQLSLDHAEHAVEVTPKKHEWVRGEAAHPPRISRHSAAAVKRRSAANWGCMSGTSVAEYPVNLFIKVVERLFRLHLLIESFRAVHADAGCFLDGCTDSLRVENREKVHRTFRIHPDVILS